MGSIYMIIDNSGSMRENGKAGLVADLFGVTRRQTGLPGVEFLFYKWGTDVRRIRTPGELDFSGVTDEEALISFLPDRQGAAVLLVGDGVISRSAARALKKAGAFYLAVGCDCGVGELRHLFGGENVYSWADCMACIHTLASGPAEVRSGEA